MTKKTEELKRIANELRADVVKMLGTKKIGHVGGSFSMADIMSVLYFDKMDITPENFYTENHDRFILSKGHSALLLYAVLAKKGFFSYEELGGIKNLGRMLQQHPVKAKIPGIEANTGSLGMGLSMGIGMALALRRKNNKDNKVYVMLGDGEMESGQVWEALGCAYRYRLNNLVAFLDFNGIQATGYNKNISGISDNFVDRFKSFHWNVIEIDGNNVDEIISALELAEKEDKLPTMIVANTVKGKGVSFAENNPNYHYNMFTQEQYDLALEELLGGKS